MLVHGDEEDAVDPGHVGVDAAEEVAEGVPVAEEFFVAISGLAFETALLFFLGFWCVFLA